jgi:hypothetical protein
MCSTLKCFEAGYFHISPLKTYSPSRSHHALERIGFFPAVSESWGFTTAWPLLPSAVRTEVSWSTEEFATAKYIGGVIPAMRNGKLPLVKIEGGNAYEGEWLNDKIHGRGIYTWADGQR